VEIEGSIYHPLSQLTNDHPFLVYTTAMAVLNICLYKYTASPVITVGSPVLRLEDGYPLVPNALAIVNPVEDELSFKEFLMKVRALLLEAYDHQNYPLEQLLQDMNLCDITNHCPLFNIALESEDIHLPLPEVKNDITLAVVQQQEGLIVRAVYNKALYREETIKRFLGHWQNLLVEALKDTNTPISRLQPLGDEEMHKLLVELNDNPADFPRDKCNHEIFEQYALQTPDAPALFYADQWLTYKQLDEKANQLARHLQELGVGPALLVGICVERSLELVIALLGAVKAGGAYVPLDPAYPGDRLAAMLEDAPMLKVLLTKEHLLERLPPHNAHTLCMDGDWSTVEQYSTAKPESHITVEDLVYVIFTSGSTGRPKGATVQHRGWTNLMHWFDTEFDIQPRDKLLVVSSFSFDITQRSLIMPLIRGAQLHLLASNHYDPDLIVKTIHEQEITVMNCSPSTFYPLVENNGEAIFDKFVTLRLLILGGEAISASRLRSWAESPRCVTEVANVYGAAECTDVSAFHRLKDYSRYVETSVPAGIPLFTSQVYIMDKHLTLAPEGVVGEIVLGGEGVGDGYINDKDLTAEKYVPAPGYVRKVHDSPILYRTGDLGRWMSDGKIEFIGRVDHQVKVRGHRIDLGDIETTLRLHEHIREAVVIDREYVHGDTRLVAYIVPGTSAVNDDPTKLSEHLKDFLKGKLPEYMVPAAYVQMDHLPLSPNGKVDRGALPDPETADSSAAPGSKAPRNPLEETLAKLFAEFLKLPRVGIEDNFFDVGGHSLLATQVIAKINEVLNINLIQTDILANPTVSDLAARVQSANERL
jgi:amino acid adenylation domain-containing protein